MRISSNDGQSTDSTHPSSSDQSMDSTPPNDHANAPSYLRDVPGPRTEGLGRHCRFPFTLKEHLGLLHVGQQREEGPHDAEQQALLPDRRLLQGLIQPGRPYVHADPLLPGLQRRPKRGLRLRDYRLDGRGHALVPHPLQFALDLGRRDGAAGAAQPVVEWRRGEPPRHERVRRGRGDKGDEGEERPARARRHCCVCANIVGCYVVRKTEQPISIDSRSLWP